MACLCVALPAAAGVPVKTKLVSVNSHDQQKDGASQYGVALSANGRFLAFQSASPLTKGNPPSDGNSDVFLRDVKKGKTTLVSRQQNSSGADRGGGECGLDMTPNARFVAFASYSERLVKHDSNGFGDVFVRDMKRGKTTLVSVSSSGKKGDADSCLDVAISDDGRYVAFSSDATKFTQGDTNGSADVLVPGAEGHNGPGQQSPGRGARGRLQRRLRARTQRERKVRRLRVRCP